MNTKNDGFTIVELLIVIVVIGILAAITIVAYNGIQNRAADTAIQSDLRALKTKIEMFRADNGVYPNGGTNTAQFTDFQFKASKSSYAVSPATEGNLWYCRNSGQDRYGIVALSKSGNIFLVTHNSSPRQYTGASAWSATGHNCNTLIDSALGWQLAGYSAADTATGPWRTWAGGN